MSAIFGVCNINGKPVDKKMIKTMLEATPYWKADDMGIWTKDSVGLGHTMLWNTPESTLDHLPYQYDHLAITMDGRLDNREELIEKLTINDRPIEQVTDSDFILAAYCKWGKDCPEYLIGDFAFAIWDEKKNQLFCAKDHLGIRPFYYCLSTDSFTFSSEIESLLSIKKTPSEVNEEALSSFVGHITVGYDQTLYKDIMRLPMGSWMIVKDGQIQEERYWKPENIQPNKTITFDEATERLKILFDEAVSARLRSYGDIGCELSGGIDSSSVLCTASILSPEKKITPFSLRYGDCSCDEGEYIDEVVNRLKIDAISIRADKIDYIHKYDMNFNYRVSKHWPLYVTFTQGFPLVEQMREQNIRVLLTGQGGDHLFEGSANMLIDYFTSLQFIKLFNALKHYEFSNKAIINFFISPFLSKGLKKRLKGFFVVLRILKESKKVTYFNEEKCKLPYDITDDKYFHSRSFKYDVSSIASNRYAMWIDSFSYRSFEQNYGVEVRHPFFDVRLVEFALSLPAEYKLKEQTRKVVLREAMKGVLPEKIRCREDKAEFSNVIIEQLKALNINELLKDSEVVKKDYISKSKLEKLKLEYHFPENLLTFWRIVNVEYWLKKRLKNDS